jgi:rSAM/selenodomain-associated transferase 1
VTATACVIAKEPVAGRVKTRLCPPLTPGEAAALAGAALRDTLAAVAAAASDVALLLDGDVGPWAPTGMRIVTQRGRGLDERLANGFADLGRPALIVGMDTPQLTPAQVRRALAALERHDAVLGPAADGGYWCIGLRRPDARALVGVPMSTADTFSAQLDRLHHLALDTAVLETLVDVDTIGDAADVARLAPQTEFASVYGAITDREAAA